MPSLLRRALRTHKRKEVSRFPRGRLAEVMTSAAFAYICTLQLGIRIFLSNYTVQEAILATVVLLKPS